MRCRAAHKKHAVARFIHMVLRGERCGAQAVQDMCGRGVVQLGPDVLGESPAQGCRGKGEGGGAEHTLNICSIFVTLDVSKLSG